MQAGKITAKLRDAVLVNFFEDGASRVVYRNIDIPDSLKELEIRDFAFDISTEGKITFRLFFDNGILPAEFPPIREKMTRAEKAAAKAAKAAEATETPEEPTQREYPFNLKGAERKGLVKAIAEITGSEAKYLGTSSYAYEIGAYTLDRNGTLIGDPEPGLLVALADLGFIPQVSEAARGCA
jgi:hypothetical protein